MKKPTPLIITDARREKMGKFSLSAKLAELHCPFTVVWENGTSNILRGRAYLACDGNEMTSVVCDRYKKWSLYRNSQQSNPSILWKGKLHDLISGIEESQCDNGFDALVAYVRSHRPELVQYKGDILFNTPSFKFLADKIVGVP